MALESDWESPSPSPSGALPQGDAELADGPGTASAARQLLRGSGLARPLLEALFAWLLYTMDA